MRMCDDEAQLKTKRNICELMLGNPEACHP